MMAVEGGRMVGEVKHKGGEGENRAGERMNRMGELRDGERLNREQGMGGKRDREQRRGG